MADGSNVTAGTSSEQGTGEGGKQEAQLALEPAGVNPSSSPTAQAVDNAIKKEDDPSSTHAGPDVKSSDLPKLPEALTKVTYRIPSYAGWFSWGKIHSVEQRALPEFFDGKSLSKTPKVYKEYRDFIINKYRVNPQRSLTFTEVRKMLVGDVNLIRKVFDCIEYWGLINNYTAPENKQQAVTAESLHSSLSEAIPPGVRIMYPCKIRLSKAKLEPNGEQSGTVSLSNLTSHRDLFAKPATVGESMVAVDESVDRVVPSSCSNCGANHSEKWFKNTKKAGFVLCETCFAAGDSHLRDDFTLTEATTGSEMLHDEWSREEVLRLLEGIAKHGENWDHVALHVETKSKAECIMQFMKLPFGDQFCNSSMNAVHADLAASPHSTIEDVEKTVKTEQKESSNGTGLMELHENEEVLESVEDADGPPTKRKRLNPLADSSNPILAQVAFLSAMVGPRVAAAAAQAALIAIAEEDPVAAQFLSSVQPSHKDSSLVSSASKESGKVEEERKEDSIACKEEHDVSRDAEIDATPSKDHLPSITQIRAAIATAIGAVGANAKLLADQEEREIEYLMATIIENQLKKLDSKVRHFEELELLLDVEHSQVERAQVQVLADWIRFSHYNYSTGPARN